jgi:hypothetical protein
MTSDTPSRWNEFMLHQTIDDKELWEFFDCPSYIKIGFIWIGSEEYQILLCMISYEVLKND